MTGTIYRKMSHDTSNAEDAIVYVNTSGTPIATIEYHNTAQRLIFNAIGSSSVWSDSVGKYSFIIGNNELKYNTYDVWYAGNDGDGSGLDADLLDGYHASSFALASQNLVYYTIDASSLSKLNFYPVTFSATDMELNCEIHSPNQPGGADYNQNYIHFLLTSCGWSDTPSRFIVLS
jgi:hypothetical protein